MALGIAPPMRGTHRLGSWNEIHFLICSGRFRRRRFVCPESGASIFNLSRSRLNPGRYALARLLSDQSEPVASLLAVSCLASLLSLGEPETVSLNGAGAMLNFRRYAALINRVLFRNSTSELIDRASRPLTEFFWDANQKARILYVCIRPRPRPKCSFASSARMTSSCGTR